MVPDAIAAYDELPLWSAMAGLLLFEHLPLRPGSRRSTSASAPASRCSNWRSASGPSATVVGLDPWAPPAGARAPQAATCGASTNAHVVRGDAAAMPFADGRHSTSSSRTSASTTSTTHRRPSPNVRASLRPDGTLAITTNLQGHMQEFYAVFDATLAEMGFDMPSAQSLQRHIEHRATVDSVRERCSIAQGYA